MSHTGGGSKLILSTLSLVAGLGCQEELSVCRITEPDCQEQIYSHMLSLRGDGYDPYNGMPPVTVISEDQFRQMLLDQPRVVNPWDRALTLLHFDSGSSSTYIDDEVANVLAFYTWGAKTITIVSHPTQTGNADLPGEMITLAHEFVHALQDQELDLQKSDFENSDAYFAYDTLIEGDARFYELLLANDLLHLGYSRSNIVSIFDKYLDNTYAYLDEYGSSLFAAQALVYVLGARYEAAQYSSGGNAAIRHGYAQAPKHMIGYLGGRNTAGSGCVAPEASLPAGGMEATDQFGALLFYTFMRGWGVSHTIALAAAESWTGDSLRLQATSNPDTTAVAWRIELSAPPPPEVTQALGATGELTIDVNASRLLITASDSPSPVTWAPVANCE